MPATAIAVLHGDQTGEELLREALRVLDPGVLGLQVETRDFDLSLEERRHTRNQCVLDAAEALRQLGFGIKAATITPEGAPTRSCVSRSMGGSSSAPVAASRAYGRSPACTRRSP